MTTDNDDSVNKTDESMESVDRVFKTIIEEMWHNYKQRFDRNTLDLKEARERLEQERSELMHDATLETLEKQFKYLMGSQNQESYEKLVSSIASLNSPLNEGN